MTRRGIAFGLSLLMLFAAGIPAAGAGNAPANAFTAGSDLSILPTGEFWEANLGPGSYIIGVDIPIGAVDLEASAGSGRVVSSDGMMDIVLDAGDEFLEEYLLDGESGIAEWDEDLLSQIADALGESWPSDVPDPVEEVPSSGDLPETGIDLADKEVLTYSEMEMLLSEATISGSMKEYRAIGFEPGVTLKISGALVVHISAEDCDLSGMVRRQRDGDVRSIGPGTYEGGKEIPEGIYTLTVTDGIGEIYTEDGEVCEMMACPEEPGINSGTYRNLEIKTGMTLTVDGVTLELQRMK